MGALLCVMNRRQSVSRTVSGDRRSSLLEAGLEQEDVLSDQDINEVLANSSRQRSVLSPVELVTDGCLSVDERLSVENRERLLPTTSNYQFESAVKPGFDPTNEAAKKECQDDLAVIQDWEGVPGRALLAVFDGHGPNGRKASAWLARTVPKLFKRNHLTDPKGSVQEAMQCTFTAAQSQIQRSGVDVKLSGSTASVCLIHEQHIHIAWVGDSRAVIARIEKGDIKAKPLTYDHKPEVPQERERIESKGGLVTNETGDPDTDRMNNPFRVFSKALFDVGQFSPGIGMSRSIGDTVANKLGVSEEPDYVSHSIHRLDRFLVIASDGLWEVFTDQEAVNFIHEFRRGNPEIYMHTHAESKETGTLDPASVALAAEAQRRWLQKYDSSVVVDDCAIIIAWLNNGIHTGPTLLAVDHRDVAHAERAGMLELHRSI